MPPFITIELQRNLHAGRDYRKHTIIWENDGTGSEEVIGAFQGMGGKGGVIEVVPLARYPGWVNYVSSGRITVVCELKWPQAK